MISGTSNVMMIIMTCFYELQPTSNPRIKSSVGSNTLVVRVSRLLYHNEIPNVVLIGYSFV